MKRILYSKDGERVTPPTWWPEHVKFEGISDVMHVENIRDAYEAGRQHFIDMKVKTEFYYIIIITESG